MPPLGGSIINATAPTNHVESVKEVLASYAKTFLSSKNLSSTPNVSADGMKFEYEWPNKESKQMMEIAEKLIAGMVRELAGQLKVTVANQDDQFEELSFETPFQRTPLMDFLETSAKRTFPADSFAETNNTGILLELTYRTVLDNFKNPNFVTRFPHVMCKQKLGTSNRVDLVVNGQSMASLYDKKGVDEGPMVCLFVIDMHVLGSLITNIKDVQQVSKYLPKEWALLRDNKLDDIPDLLDSVKDSLLALWKGTGRKSQKKVIYLMNLVGSDLLKFMRDQVPNVWHGNYFMVQTLLQSALVVLEKWQRITEELTTVAWVDDWKKGENGEKYEDELLTNTMRRIEEVLKLRAIHVQLVLLLSKKELQDMGADKIWEPFATFDPTHPLLYSANTTGAWEKAVQEFHRRVETQDSRVAVKLRNALSTSATSSFMLLQVFQRFKDIIKRPTTTQELSAERDSLMVVMDEMVTGFKQTFEAKQNTTIGIGTQKQSKEIRQILWARQLKFPIEQILHTAKCLLADLPKMEKFTELANKLCSDIDKYEKECFHAWQGNVHTLMQDAEEPIVIQMSGSLLTSREGKMIVTFNEKFTEIIGEVRQLLAMGFHIPQDVQVFAAKCYKFHRQSLMIRQLACWYNSTDTQILKCHKLILSDLAHQFESAVAPSSKEKKRITWNSLNDADLYCAKLSKIQGSFQAENRRLRKAHVEMEEKCIILMNVDLLKNADKWKVTLKEVRERFSQFERSHHKAGIEIWKVHWDYQLYKSLEHQYQLGLETLNENLTELKVELIFKQGMIQFRPSLEYLREKYFQKMKEFITIPLRFRGTGGADFYRFMPEQNEGGVLTVYQNAEALFSKLSKVKRRFKDWVVLGTVDLDSFVLEHLTTIEDFKCNYNLVKEKEQQLQKLEDVIKVDCITVSTAPIKATVEDHLSRLLDSMQNAIQLSARRDVASIEEFLDDAMVKLKLRPSNLDEVEAANNAYLAMNQQQAELQSRFAGFDDKNRLLRMMGFNPMDLASIQGKWSQFNDALEAHTKVIEVQLDKMRGSLSNTIDKFSKELNRFAHHWNESKPKDIDHYKNKEQIWAKCVDYMKERRSELDDMKQRKEHIRNQAEYFKMPVPDFTDLDEVEVDIATYEEQWNLYESFETELKVITDEEWLTFRSKYFKFEDFVREWVEKLGACEKSHINTYLNKKCELWLEMVPCLKFLRGDGFTPEHWSMMFKALELDKGLTADKLQFHHFVDKAELITDKADDIKALHMRAQGEIQIREALQELRTWGNECCFQTFLRSEGGRNVPLVKDWKDITTAVSDNESLLNSLKDSPYYSYFQDEAQAWEAKLIFLNETLPQMVQLQRKWIYLEPIFARGALPSEQARFRKVDKEFVAMMKEIEADKRVVTVTRKQELLTTLPKSIEQLDRCQKALNEFLEEKRDKFPRFYFIGDDDMLEILGQAQNPAVIQAHLKKLFAGIAKVQFDESMKQITAMCSAAGEVVPLKSPVVIKPEVEVWLGELDLEMRETLKDMLITCYENFEVEKYPSQILCLREFVWFTQNMEEHIKKGTVPEFKAELQQKLNQFTAIETGVSRVMELKMKALILDLIHNIEVADLIINSKCTSLDMWTWTKQLRFYLNDNKECTMKMVDAKFIYTYEYQGNAPKLVHTPLTDKCYLTLTQGMHLGYGGNPYGPAGTGKTESVKALGNAMGRQVLVFNCDEGIDFKSMGRIFMGLVKCGAWGCFDEFNRLKEDQLSAISDMIQVIQAALKMEEKQVYLLGRTIDLNPSAGIFVTLNPAGKNYGGRSKLPENLKQLFRPVAMTVPDTGLICEIELYSEGFSEAKVVGKKLVEVFNLSRDLLSSQQHYDWGLRALKTILRTAGSLKSIERRQELAAAAEEAEATGEGGETAKQIKLREKTPAEVLTTESEIVIRSLRVNTLSKLTFDDSKIFNGIVTDVFPGIATSDVEHAELTAAIKDCMTKLKLQIIDTQIHKILQLNEAMLQRMGVVLVGPSGAGKSTLLKVLRQAYAQMKQPIPQHVMNPKAMPRHQLLGFMDMDTREWNDGVLTAAARKVMLEPLTTRSWILCDGDIDPEWVESLNSVLDDNRLLTMPNGERIQFGDNVNFMFETHSLAFASPATVSRMSVIYLSEEDVDPHSTVKSWLSTLPEEQSKLIGGWIEEYFYRAVEKLVHTKKLVLDTTRMGLVMSGLSHLGMATNKSEFCLGLIRGLGSYLSKESRIAYATEVFKLCGEAIPDARRPLDCYWDPERNCFDNYYYTMKLESSIEALQSNQMVPTIDVQRNVDIMRPWISTKKPFLLVGPEGCGKNMLVMNIFEQHASNTKVAVINCSGQTSSVHVIQKLNQMCNLVSTNNGRVLRPKDCDHLVLFLKDLNLPKPDKYATTQLHCFLQQMILYEGYYAPSLEWIGISNIQIVGSMNPHGGVGRYPLVTRFTAITCVVSISYPDTTQLQTIYSEYVAALISAPPLDQHPKWGQVSHATEIAKTLVAVYEQVKKRYNVDEKSHYIFTPRELTDWVKNLMNYDMENNELLHVMSYEGERIFSDRLVSEDHRKKFKRILGEEMLKLGYQQEKKRGEDCFVSFAHAAHKVHEEKAEGNDDKKEEMEEKKQTKKSSRKLMSRISQDDLENVLQKGLISYSREYRALDIMMIEETLWWTARADRILSQAGGSLLFAGRPGVGRRNIVCLCCSMLRMVPYQLSMTKDYTLKAFKLELKHVLHTAGIQNEDICLIVEDHNLVRPEFIEMINSLLASGEVPGLYTSEELNALLVPLQEECSAEGFYGGTYQFFVNRIQKRLHVALLFDPLGHDYELRCQSNPAIYTKCGILWMDQWSNDGMRMVPKMVLKDIFQKYIKDAREKAGDDPEKLKDLTREAEVAQEKLTKNLLYLHESVGNSATPLRYIQFLKAYASTYKSQYAEVSMNKKRLSGGLSKLHEAEQSVDVLARDAAQQKKQLAAKQEQADKALEEIQASMEKASEQKKEAEALKAQLGVEGKDLAAHTAEIEKQLSGVQPLLDAAKEAVGHIKAENLNEIRALKMPPEAIRDVLEAVLCVMGIFDTSWISMKKFLAQRGVVQSILDFDAHDLKADVREKVRALLDQKPNSFKPEVIKRASVAAAPLAAWVTANLQYAEVLQRTEPLEAELAKLKDSLQKTQAKLGNTEDQLKKVDKKVKEMKKTFKNLTSESEKLRIGLEKAEEILKGAQELLGKLTGEKTRWEEQVKELDEQLQEVSNYSLLSAAYMIYISGEDEDKRRHMQAAWREKLGVKHYVFKDFMRTESKLLAYKSEGLPADDLSMENGIVILESMQTCLIIDPAQQAFEWLKTHFAHNRITVDTTTAADDRFQTTLELSVRFGKTLIISEVDKVEPILYPILRQDLMTAGPKRTVQIGEKQIDWQDSFRLYLITRNPNLLLPPDAAALVSMVNFAITRSGLEGQLLGVTLQHEKPELEEQKSKLLQQEEEYKMQLAELEEELLKQLASTEGSLLDNKELIEALNQIKTKSSVVKDSLEESHSLQEALDKQREEYRPFANQGSVVYFLMQDLRAVSHMYQFALSIFMRLFMATLSSNKDLHNESLDAKISALKQSLVERVFAYVSRSLFKEDRLLFGLHMALSLHPEKFPDAERDFFMNITTYAVDPEHNSAPAWIDTDILAPYQALMKALPDVHKKLNISEATAADWQSWMHQPTPEGKLPVAVTDVTVFQQAISVAVFRPDRLPVALERMVTHLLGLDSINPPTVNLQHIAEEETNPAEPILMITTPGADPSQEWTEMAAKVAGPGRFTQLAMGGGQTVEAIQMLKQASQNREWLLLKNLHLVVAWVTDLEKEFTNLSPNEGFQLWLTSEPHAAFPSILLRSSLKVTFQAPPGMKKNLLRSFDMWSPEAFNEHSNLEATIRFILAWFHAIVQERRTFTPQGWVKFYEFSTADLRAGGDVIAAQCAHGTPDWDTVLGVFANAIYGGRLDNDYDIRILDTYLQKYFNNQMLGEGNIKLTKDIELPKVKDARNKHEVCMGTIQKLTEVDSPDLFNLPPNAARMVQKNAAMKMIEALGKLKDVSETGSGAFNREAWAVKLKPLFTLWASLTENHKEIFDAKDPPKKELSPLSSFVWMEADIAHQLVTRVNAVMQELQKIVAGTALLTQKIHVTATYLMAGDVPVSWDKAWEGPENIQMWLRYVAQRAVALQEWLKLDEAGTLLSSSIRLNHVFRPITFLNAFRQETARQSGQALDSLILDCAWGEGATVEGAAVSIKVEGLLITGASFDGTSLQELQSDSPGLSPCPICKLAWVLNPKSQGNVVKVPCYLSSSREKLLCGLNVPCNGDIPSWILSGFALLLEQ